MKLALGQIADWIHAEGEFDLEAIASGYSIDSRTLGAGDLFFAVRGERVDGHEYVEQALANGAVAAVVSMRWLRPATVAEAKLLRVPDHAVDEVLVAMQTVAREVRRLWGGRVVGITGSAGKTTTKECVAAVLGAGFRVLKTEGNLNNHFGVPLQLLRLEPEHEIAVLEMGMNHAGEITLLAQIAEPEWAVVTNVLPVHLEHFAEGIEGIAKAKKELVDALPATGFAILNGDDPRVSTFGRNLGARALLYGTAAACKVRAEEIEELGLAGTTLCVHTDEQRHSLTMRLPGMHNVLNALAACTAGLLAGIPLAACCEALEQLRPTEKRGSIVAWHGAQIINDAYNSNPRALDAMVATLVRSPATRRVLIAGEMLELGPEGAALHAECGRAAAQEKLDIIVGVRGLATHLVDAARVAGAQAFFVETPEEAGAWMRANLREGDLVLLKASRGVRLERALEALNGVSS